MAARLIHASLTEDKFATDRILTRAVEANLDGLFFAFTFHTGPTKVTSSKQPWSSSTTMRARPV